MKHPCLSLAACGLALALAANILILVASGAPLRQQGTPTTTDVDEVALMRRLRRGFLETGMRLAWRGWERHEDDSHPCSWWGVDCDAEQRINKISIACRDDQGVAARAAQPLAGNATGPLPRELADLPRLEELFIECSVLTRGSVPPGWGVPGAWPALKHLEIEASALQGQLPDIQPGALRALRHLRLTVQGLRSTLPASWGGAGVLPALRTLQLYLDITGSLPSSWGAGFPRLEELVLSGRASWGSESMPPGEGDMGQPPGNPPASQPLPKEWTAPGSFPSLRILHLGGLGIAGSLPRALVDGSLPHLTQLSLPNNLLSSTLLPQLFANNTRLCKLWLGGNRFAGPLPLAWANSMAVQEVNLQGNALTGPAFPPAWLAPGAMPHLMLLHLGAKSALTGTLPARLPWPLSLLGVKGTAVHGSIPAAWCSLQPLAGRLTHLWVSHSGVAPVLPACARESMPHLRLYPLPSGEDEPAEKAARLQHRQRWRAAAGVLVAAVPLVAFATIALWRQQRRLGPARRSSLLLAPVLTAQHLTAASAGRPQGAQPGVCGCKRR
ncbi:hypothetical protein ABPG75_006484 [Micractinium tetrahymenae]